MSDTVSIEIRYTTDSSGDDVQVKFTTELDENISDSWMIGKMFRHTVSAIGPNVMGTLVPLEVMRGFWDANEYDSHIAEAITKELAKGGQDAEKENTETES